MDHEFVVPPSREENHQPRGNKSRLYNVDSSEMISHDKMSWDREDIDFVGHEAASSSEDSCSSTSGSSTRVNFHIPHLHVEIVF